MRETSWLPHYPTLASSPFFQCRARSSETGSGQDHIAGIDPETFTQRTQDRQEKIEILAPLRPYRR